MILQIAAGVVLGGLALYALPLILVLGVYVILGLVALLAAGSVLWWLFDNPTLIFFGIAAAVVLAFYFDRKQKKFDKSTSGLIKQLEATIKRREDTGYDSVEQKKELRRLINQLNAEREAELNAQRAAVENSASYIKSLKPKIKRVSQRALEKEHERRKKMGYDS